MTDHERLQTIAAATLLMNEGVPPTAFYRWYGTGGVQIWRTEPCEDESAEQPMGRPWRWRVRMPNDQEASGYEVSLERAWVSAKEIAKVWGLL